jgi:UDP-glucose/galactose:(glucosyl)LPS alpha-1,2-glucosyl/galactosyltransferase
LIRQGRNSHVPAQAAPSGPIHVAFASDDVGITGLAVAAFSAVERSSRPVHVWVIEEGVGAADRENVRKALAQLPTFASLTFVPHSSLPIKLPSWWGRVRWPLLAAARFQLAEILPAEARRCIYLDIDIVVGTDLCELFDIDMRGEPIAMVPNTGMSQDIREYLKRQGLDPDRYCNSGVLLMDLETWRRERVGPALIECGRRMPPDVWFYDQDMLNTFFRDRCLLLEERWNCRDAGVVADGRVQHFAGHPKPWETRPSDDLNVGLAGWHRVRRRSGFVAQRRPLRSGAVKRLKAAWAMTQRLAIRWSRRRASAQR